MASVFLGDLNDFIAPSQACVNPLFAAPKDTSGAAAGAGSSAAGVNGAGAMELVLEDEEAWSVNISAPPLQEPDLIKSTAGQTATVTLNDCLACSGCVTSAETVLISQQSTAKLLEALRSGTHSISVVSLSPQSRASLADHFGASLLETQARVTTLLQALGVTHIIDASCAGDLCLVAARDELIGRIKASQSSTSSSSSTTAAAAPELPPWRTPAHTVAVSRAVQTELATGQAQAVPPPQSDAPLPLLVSACPGWVCYAEKTTPEAIPYMSAVKSPQQVLGALLKGAAARAWGVTAAQVLHVSVQPCFDRKLEASRLDFWDAESDSSEVDLVLSTAELLELIVQQCGGSEAQVRSACTSSAGVVCVHYI
jgi:iron only hydrogenase large subunit-like protein